MDFRRRGEVIPIPERHPDYWTLVWIFYKPRSVADGVGNNNRGIGGPAAASPFILAPHWNQSEVGYHACWIHSLRPVSIRRMVGIVMVYLSFRGF